MNSPSSFVKTLRVNPARLPSDRKSVKTYVEKSRARGADPRFNAAVERRKEYGISPAIAVGGGLLGFRHLEPIPCSAYGLKIPRVLWIDLDLFRSEEHTSELQSP